MNKWIKIAAPVVVLGVGFGVFTLLDVFKPEPEKEEEAARPVNVFVEKIVPIDVKLEEIGRAHV